MVDVHNMLCYAIVTIADYLITAPCNWLEQEYDSITCYVF